MTDAGTGATGGSRVSALKLSASVSSQASAPVIVHLPEALVRSAGGVFASGGTGVLVMAVFGAVLGVLGIVIVALVFYIYKK